MPDAPRRLIPCSPYHLGCYTLELILCSAHCCEHVITIHCTYFPDDLKEVIRCHSPGVRHEVLVSHPQAPSARVLGRTLESSLRQPGLPLALKRESLLLLRAPASQLRQHVLAHLLSWLSQEQRS